MTLGSDNPFPSILVTEGTTPASPAAGKQRLFVRSSDHVLCYVNSSGTVSPVASGASGSITASGYTQSTARLLGRSTAATGAIEEITVGTGLSLSAGSLTATGGAAGALVLLEQHAASASATLDFTAWYSATYDEYLIEVLNLVPATNAVDLFMRMSTDGGSTYDTASVYQTSVFCAAPSGTANGSAFSQDHLQMRGASEVTNAAANGGATGSLRLYSPGSTTVVKHLVGAFHYLSSGTNPIHVAWAGVYSSTTAVNGVRFLFSSGNIASGTIRVYGIAKT